MGVLIFTPTYADAMRPETAASIQAQTGDIEWTWEVSRHNPYPGERNMRNIVAQYQRAWELALAGGYDALLTVEHDMVLPANALQALYNTDAGVVYGVYMLRHGTKALNAWQYINNRSMGMSLSLYPAELNRYRRRGWGRVSGVGWGCTLIRREILNRISPRYTDSTDAGDIRFSTDCLHAGIEMIARFDVPCLHIEPDGTVLHPYRNGGIVRRVLALQAVTVNSDGQTIVMKPGSYYSVTPDVANDLQRAGYVAITNNEPEMAVAQPVTETATAPAQRGRKRAAA